ncbi:MAG: hypothetical protein KAS93_03680 [Gammaproteobacteria bacterium]|nr:hypothetical protein [Gammaproteobacteria bacterium]
MKKIVICVCALFCVFSAYAGENVQSLNRVVLNLRAEQWVQTKSARVIVNVNAALDKSAMATAHAVIMRKLEGLSNKGRWHITSFNRSQGQSGLEQLKVVAQARLKENALANLRDQAKAVSKPGFTFSIARIVFQPNLVAFERVRAKLRARIYAQALAELKSLNDVYSKQHFYLHTIDFVGRIIAAPLARNSVAMMAYKTGGSASSLSVSNKEVINAQVVFASSTKG